MNYSKHKLYTILILTSLFIISLFISCDKDSDDTSNTPFDIKEQLTNIYVNGIFPLAENFEKETVLLSNLINQFSEETTEGNLKSVQQQWKEVQLIWKQLELYDIGDIANSFIAFEINRWPTDVLRIEENIVGSQILNEEYIASIGSSSKGIAAIEYLIFSLDGNTSVLNKFTTDQNATRRKEYVNALSENLKAKSLELKNLWEKNEEKFVNAIGNGINGSQNQVVNAMVTLMEEIIKSKLGSPLGDANGGTIESKRLEAYTSGFSKNIIDQHLKALKQCFTGDFDNGSSQLGFDDFLIYREHKTLSDKILVQISVCQDRLTAISGLLRDEISINQEPVVALKDSFRDLLVLVKVDMSNLLGFTITFNDSDGD